MAAKITDIDVTIQLPNGCAVPWTLYVLADYYPDPEPESDTHPGEAGGYLVNSVVTSDHGGPLLNAVQEYLDSEE